jgi:hypothetical protein
VFDAETNQPLVGEISYYFFGNRELEAAIPGLRAAYVDGRYWTNANGEFRVPVLPSRGILAFRDSGSLPNGDNVDRFPRGFGANAIEGAEELGGTKMFPTAPSYLIPANYTRVAEVHPMDGEETVRVDMPLLASRPITLRAVDEEAKPVGKFQVYGASERAGWQQTEGPQFEIVDLLPGEQRKVFVYHRDRNLVGGGIVKHGTEETVQIELTRAGSIEGRLVDADGEPITDASLTAHYEKLGSGDNSAIWAPHPRLTANPTNIPVDKQGRFRLEGLIPGWSYHARASAPRKMGSDVRSTVIGSPFEDLQVEPGEHKDLGDVVVERPQ